MVSEPHSQVGGAIVVLGFKVKQHGADVKEAPERVDDIEYEHSNGRFLDAGG